MEKKTVSMTISTVDLRYIRYLLNHKIQELENTNCPDALYREVFTDAYKNALDHLPENPPQS